MMRFKASRGLIRNVMRELTYAGFINARPRSGYVVSAGARNLGGCIGLIVPGVFHEEIFSPICQEISRIAVTILALESDADSALDLSAVPSGWRLKKKTKDGSAHYYLTKGLAIFLR